MIRSIFPIAAFLLLWIPSSILYAQESKLNSFAIEGSINADTGTLVLMPLYDTDFYPEDVEKVQARVENNKVHFSGSMPYPMGFTLQYENSYASRLFVVEPGQQSITINLEANREVPEVTNQAMREYQNDYLKAFETITQRRNRYDERRASLRQKYQDDIPDEVALELEKEYKSIYAQSDSLLMQYVADHPDSYLALWKLVELFGFVGYEDIYVSAYAHFSDALKNTYTGKVLGEKLQVAAKLAQGKPFPTMETVDTDLQEYLISYTDFTKNQYTFVDFWYSNCSPCIAQFPHLRETYEKYREQGFEIVGISTDRIRYQDMWMKAIERFELVWPQYWDKDGKESAALAINRFPTNYLLDSEGKIIAKDLRPVELEQFLAENIR
ncbi:TlpA disulfide reductase family protein [Catalinimonas sp. 4WD22]|uniref:TlpA disulfide reductase family protein n=1 Tax=Catalinimonas locisalis TaxID=3133978 RepID=UPI0031011E5F